MRIRINKTEVRCFHKEVYLFHVDEAVENEKHVFYIYLGGGNPIGRITAPTTNSDACIKARELASFRVENLAKFALEDKPYDLYGCLQTDQQIVDTFREEN